MPKNHVSASSSGLTRSIRYEDSPLKQAIMRGLDEIHAIESRYPVQADESMERKHARKVFSLVKDLIQLMDNNVLPKFTKQRTPGVIDTGMLLKHGMTVYRMSKKMDSRATLLLRAACVEIRQYIQNLPASSTSSTSLSLTEQLVQHLSARQEILFAKAMKIPGQPPQELFDFLEQQLRTLQLDTAQNLHNSKVLNGYLKRLKRIFIGRRRNEVDFPVADVMSWELALTLVNIMDDLPERFRDLFTFFAPESITAQLNGDTVQSFIKKFSNGRQVRLIYVAPGPDNPRDFLYVLRETREEVEEAEVAADEVESMELMPDSSQSHDQDRLLTRERKTVTRADGTTALMEYRTIERVQHITHLNFQYGYESLPQLFPRFVSPWFERYANSPDVQYARRYTEMLMRLTALLRNPVAEFYHTCQQNVVERPWSPAPFEEDNLPFLHSEVSRRCQLTGDLERLTQDIALLQAQCQTMTVGQLLANHTEIMAVCPDLRPWHRNVLLPRQIICPPSPDTHASELVKIGGSITQLINEAKEEIPGMTRQNQQLLAQFRQQEQEQEQALHNEKEQFCISVINKEAWELSSYRERIHRIDNEKSGLLRATDTEQAIEAGLSQLDALIEQIVLILSGIIASAKGIDAAIQPDLKLLSPELGNRLQQSIETAACPVRVQANNLTRECKELHASLTRAKELLLSKMQKIESDRQLSESMQKASHQSLLETQQQWQTQLDAARQEKASLDQQTHEVQGRYDAKSEACHQHETRIAGFQEDAGQYKKYAEKTREQLTVWQQETEALKASSAQHGFLDPTPQKTIDFLQQIKSCLATDKINFEKIERICNEHGKRYEEVLETLAAKTTLTANQVSGSSSSSQPLAADKIDWKEFQSRQDDWYRIKPDAPEYQIAWLALTTGIDHELQKINNQITITERLEQLKEHTDILAEVLVKNQELLQKSEQALTQEEADLHTAQEELSGLLQEVQQRVQGVTMAEGNISGLATRLNALGSMCPLRKDIEDLQTDIASFASNVLHFGNGSDMTQQISTLKTRLDQLNGRQSLLSESALPETLQPGMAGMKNLLDAIDRQLRVAIEEKALRGKQDFETRLTLLQQDIEAINVAESASLPQVTSLLQRLTDASTRLNREQQTLQILVTRMRAAENDYCTATAGKLERWFAALQTTITNAQERLTTANQAKLEALAQLEQHEARANTLAEQIFALEFAETPAAQQAISAVLEPLAEAVDPFPTGAALTLLATTLGQDYTERRTALSDFQANISTRYQQCQNANEALGQRTAARAQTHADWHTRLDTYLADRNHRYLVKDALSNRDKYSRTNFITELKNRLDNWAADGDSAPVLAALRTGINSYPGRHLKALLFGLLVTLKDFERQVPVNYLAEPAPAPDIEAELNQGAFEQESFAAVLQLRGRIDFLNGQDMLRTRLKDDLVRFVNSHQQRAPTADDFHDFHETFSARLHSIEPELRQQRHRLKPVIANILIGLATLGTLILGKMAHSKIKHGYVRLFFDQSREQKRLHEVDDSLRQVAPVA